MAITIQAIEQKEFKTKAHGYDPDEVDLFLDQIADTFEEMQREMDALRTSQRMQQSVYATPAPVSTVVDNSVSAQRLLQNAQRVADETIADAKGQVDKLMSDANVQANSLLRDAKAQKMEITDSMEMLRNAASSYRDRFKKLLDDQLATLNASGDLFK